MRSFFVSIFALSVVLGGGACTAFFDTALSDVPVDGGDDVTNDAGDDASNDVTTDADGGGDVARDVRDAGSANACGGVADLEATPGRPCGDCGHGTWSCDGPDAVVCRGTSTNACGGCAPLPGVPREPCGACDGRWRCDPDNADRLYCDAPSNVCGGCDDLTTDGAAGPGRACTPDGTDAEGIRTCIAVDEIACVPAGQNACGGDAALDAVPGERCGRCDGGVVVCDGPNATACRAETEGINACGSCGPLVGDVGAACDDCGGLWTCLDGTLRCDNDGRNACGGCAVLPGVPGADCDGGRWRCAGPDDLACAPGGGDNACGGRTPFAVSPNEPCGDYANGRVYCAGPEAVGCELPGPANECGGVRAPAAAIGAACGAERVWACDISAREAADDGVSCLAPAGQNGCGGTADLNGREPFDACGDCTPGIFACTSPDRTECVAPEGPPEVRWWPDEDGDGFGDGDRDDESIVACDPGEGWAANPADCDDDASDVNPDADEVVGNERDDNCDGTELCYIDADGDGYLPDEPRSDRSFNESCRDVFEAPASAPRGDCSPLLPDVNPGEREVCNNLVDDDCNDATPDRC